MAVSGNADIFSIKVDSRLIWHFTYPSPTTLPEPALWATYVFLKEHTTKIRFRGDSCMNQYGFQP